MASIERLPNGSWKARYRSPNGGSRSRSFKRKVDAQSFLNDVETKKAAGDYVDRRVAMTPFSEIADGYLATKADVASRTRINIEGRLRNHILPAFGDRPISRIAPVDVRRFVAGLVAAGLKPSTVRGAYNTLAAIMRQAEHDRVITRSPCVDIKLPADGQGVEMHFLSAAEVNALADAITPLYRLAVLTAAFTGMRAGELWALAPERLDLLRGEVHVVASVAEVRGGLELGPTKTRQRRTVALPRFLAQELGEALTADQPFVFLSAEGTQVRHRNFMRRHFDPAVAAVGLAPLRFHDLRHTNAAMLIAKGHSLQEVKTQLGHSSIRVTSDRYGHLYPEARTAMAASLDDLYEISRVRSVSDAEILPLPDMRQAP